MADAGAGERRVCVGAVAGAFGVRGEARLKPFTADPQAIGAYGPVETEDGGRRFDVTITGAVKGGVAARLSGVATREEAHALRGQRLYVPRSALPEPEEDEYYHADLVGLAVVDFSGEVLGHVRAVQNYGAGDFLEIDRPNSRRPSLMPFTRAAAPHVDLAAGEIVVDPPAGVFDDAEAGEDERSESESDGDGDGGAAG